MEKVETEFLDKELLKPSVWLRYIDDIFFVWAHGEESLQQFLEYLNGFHPGPRFASEFSAHQVNFLDVIVKLQENEFFIDLYCKKTDCYQYLHYDSCYPEHMKKFSVYKKWLHGRGYPEHIIDNQLKHVKNVSREELLRPKVIGVPFIVTF